MASFTMTLRDLVKNYETQWNQVVSQYPIFDESYRETLNNRIFKTLKWYEIGYETPELFLDRLEAWLDLNMQDYNFLYESNLIKIEPLLRIQLLESFRGNKTTDNTTNKTVSSNETTTLENETNTTNSNTSNTTTTDLGKTDTTTSTTEETTSTTNQNQFNSDFPQGSLTTPSDTNYYSTGSKTDSNDSTNVKQSGTNGTVSQNTTTQENESTGTGNSTVNQSGTMNSSLDDDTTFNGTENNTHTLEKTGLSDRTDSSMLMEYRQTFINIDRQLIEALKSELFILIYNVD